MNGLLYNLLFGVLMTLLFGAGALAAVRQPQRHPQSGELQLAYGTVLRAFALVVTIGVPIAIGALFLSGQISSSTPPSKSDVAAFVCLEALFIVPGGILLVESMCVRVIITDNGIDMHSPWRRGRFIRWEEVESVSFSGTMYWFRLRDVHRQTIHLHLWLGGLIAFCDIARRKLDHSVIARASRGFKLIDSQAGRRTL